MRENEFSLTRTLLYKDGNVEYGRIRVSENSYSPIFYAVVVLKIFVKLKGKHNGLQARY